MIIFSTNTDQFSFSSDHFISIADHFWSGYSSFPYLTNIFRFFRQREPSSLPGSVNHLQEAHGWCSWRSKIWRPLGTDRVPGQRSCHGSSRRRIPRIDPDAVPCDQHQDGQVPQWSVQIVHQWWSGIPPDGLVHQRHQDRSPRSSWRAAGQVRKKVARLLSFLFFFTWSDSQEIWRNHWRLVSFQHLLCGCDKPHLPRMEKWPQNNQRFWLCATRSVLIRGCVIPKTWTLP